MTAIGPGFLSNHRLPDGHRASSRAPSVDWEKPGADRAAQSALPSATATRLQTLQVNTAFIAQELSQQDRLAGNAREDGDGGEPAAVTAFLEFMAKTPEERYFETFLKARGMTQEEFDALPAEEMRAVLKEFQEYVRQSVENDSAEKVARAVRSELL